MMTPKHSCRLFSSHDPHRERRLAYFSPIGPSAEYFGSKEPECDPNKRKHDEVTIPVPGPVTPEETAKPDPEPNFDEIRFDLRPDEPTHIYNEKGESVRNRSDQIRSMSRDQFREHLQFMFGKHMKSMMDDERHRQHRLVRGRVNQESKMRFPDTRQGRKDRKAWKEQALSKGDELFEEAEQEFQAIAQSPEELFGGEYENMLAQITNDVWSSAEFQRGTANYVHAYQKAWHLYADLAQQEGYDDEAMAQHPFFESALIRTGMPPGRYINGQLIGADSRFIGRKAPSRYAEAKYRQEAGVSQNPEKDFLKGEEAVVRKGYEKTWRNVFQRRNPLGSKAEEDAYVQRLVDQNLKKQGFRKEQIDRSKLPDPDLLRLPAEADRKTRADYVSAHDNIDARDRAAVIGAVRKQLNLKNVRTVRDFQKKVRLDEIDLSSIAAGMPQVLHYATKATNRRGAPVEGKSGLVIVDRGDEDASTPTEANILDFAAVDTLLDTDNPWKEGYAKSNEISNAALSVRDEFIRSLRDGNDIFKPGIYQQLVAVCRKNMRIPFALDELRTVTNVSERASRLGQKLKNIFLHTDVFKEGANWEDEHKQEFRKLKLECSAADRELLKTLTRERCVWPNGDIDATAFEAFWRGL